MIETQQLKKNMFDTGHFAFYDAIRSNDVDDLEALIQSAKSESNIWYHYLSEEYESLKLKNVHIHETMEIFVEETLVREHFFRDITNANDTSKSKPKTNADLSPLEVRIYHRLQLIITEANELNKIISLPYIENPKAAIALLISRHIRAVKEDLKSTYSLIPWEEMEFYLSRYSFLSTVDKQKLICHLIKFIDKLKIVFGMQDDFINESHVQQNIKNYIDDDVPIHRKNIDKFDDFYTDYELIKDEYSLTKMLRYTELAIEVNPEEQSGRLIIQRALQVIGEYVKNSLASPHLSQKAQESFIRNMMSVVIEIVPLLRNIMAHADTLHAIYLRNSVESEEGFFTKVQGDLIEVIGVIVSVLRSIKTKRFIVWCENIIRENNNDVFDDLCAEFLDYLQESELPEVDEPLVDALTKVNYLFANIREMIAENPDNCTVKSVESAIAKFESIIAFDKHAIADEIKTFNSHCQSIKEEIHGQLGNGKLTKRRDKTTENFTVLNTRKTFFKKFPFVAFDRLLNQRGCERTRNYSIMVLWTCQVEINIRHEKVFEYLSDIRAILRRVLQMSKSIEGFKEKFDITQITSSNRNDNTKRELDHDFRAVADVLGNSEVFKNFQSVLERKKEIHDLKLKINGCYEDNKDQLTQRELFIVDEELLARRCKGKDFLVTDCYEEFLNEKREIGKFIGSLRLKGNETKFMSIFNEIKSQHDDYSPKLILNETIQHMENELTKDQYEDLKEKFIAIEQEHEAKKKLISFFDCDIELEKKEYEQLVGTLNVKSKTKFEKLYKVVQNRSTVLDSIDDTYGALIDVLKNKESTVVKICNSYVNFLQSLHIDAESTKLLKRAILDKKIFRVLENRFSKQLQLLKKMLGNFKTRESKCALISRYRSDINLRASVETVLFDLCNLSMIADTLWIKFLSPSNKISMKFLENGFFYLNGTLPFLTGNSPLRNYLAHGDALIDALPFDSSIAVISCAILFCEEAESLTALRILVNDDKMAKNLHQISKIPDQDLPKNLLSKLKCSIETVPFGKSNSWKYFQTKNPKNHIVKIDVCLFYEQYLNQCVSQVSLFTAASQGDKIKLESLVESGEEIYSRESKMWSLSHIAANEGHKHIVQFLFEHGAKCNAKYEDGVTPDKALLFEYSEVTKLIEAHINVEANINKKISTTDFECVNSEKGSNKIKPWSSEIMNDNKSDAIRSKAPIEIDEQLREAVSDGKLEIVEALVKKGANLNLTVDGGSLLLLAASLGHNELVKFFLNHEKLRSEMKNNVLHSAVLFGNYDTVKTLVEIGKIDINTRDKSGATPLQIAVFHNHLNIVEYFMNQTILFDDNITEYGILNYAVLHSYSDLVKYLIGKMSDRIGEVLECTDNQYGINLLHTAIGLGFTDIVNTLLQTKHDEAFVNSYDKHRQTPLCYAASIGHTSLVETLLKYGADVNATKNHLTSPLEMATMLGFEKIVKILLKKGADVNVKRTTGKTPIIHAASIDDVEILESLLENHADVDTRDHTSRTALHHASIAGYKRSVNILLDNGADPNCSDILGQTPFFYAVSRGSHEIVQLLSNTGALI